MTNAGWFDPENEGHVAVYDELTLWSSFAGQLLLEHVPFVAGRALDLGCGAGFPLLELADRMAPHSRAYGLDPWRLALERARRKREIWSVARAELVRGDGARLPFRDESFD